MLKHGQDGWIHRRRLREGGLWHLDESPSWDWVGYVYCAVRIEKITTSTPLPIEHYRRGMEVRTHSGMSALVLHDGPESGQIRCAWSASVGYIEPCKITQWRWPIETEWHPAYTETFEEREVERLEVEG